MLTDSTSLVCSTTTVTLACSVFRDGRLIKVALGISAGGRHVIDLLEMLHAVHGRVVLVHRHVAMLARGVVGISGRLDRLVQVYLRFVLLVVVGGHEFGGGVNVLVYLSVGAQAGGRGGGQAAWYVIDLVRVIL